MRTQCEALTKALIPCLESAPVDCAASGIRANRPLALTGLILWTLLPSLIMWVGLYELKSAAWTFALYHGLCLVPAIILGRGLWQGTMVRPAIKHCLILAVVALLFSGCAVLGWELMGSMMLSNAGVNVLLRQQGITGEPFVFFALYAIVVNPLVEELFWRGVVLNQLDRMQTPFRYFGIIWSSIGYALFHYMILRLVLYPGWAELGVILLALYGAGMALLYRKTGSILTTAFAHGILTDLACVVLLIDYFRHFGMP